MSTKESPDRTNLTPEEKDRLSNYVSRNSAKTWGFTDSEADRMVFMKWMVGRRKIGEGGTPGDHGSIVERRGFKRGGDVFPVKNV